jgi:hypothetical protein
MCIYPGKEISVFVLRRGERLINPGNWNRCIHSSERQQLNILSILEKGKGVSNRGDGELCISILVKKNGESMLGKRGNGRSILLCATCRKGTLVYKSILRQHVQVALVRKQKGTCGLIDYFRYL